MRVAQESARGTVILFVGNFLSTGITTVTIIVMARLLGPDGYGIYTLAFVIPTLLSQFIGIGVNVAVTRYVAFSVSKGEIERAKSITRTATLFLLGFGLLLSAANFILAPFLAPPLLHRPELASTVQLTSLWILGLAMTQSTQSAFIGWSSMGAAGGFNVLLSVLKLVITIGLILTGFGVYGAIIGHVSSYLLEGIVSAVFLYSLWMRPWSHGVENFVGDIKGMIGYGFPIFAAQIVVGLATQYTFVVLAFVATDAVVGFYQAAGNVTIAITVLSAAFSSSLFRSFAALDGLKEDISLAFAYSVKYVSYVLTPLVFLLLATATPLVDLAYGSSYASSVVLLQIAVISYLPVAAGFQVLASFFNGVGKSRLTLYISIIAAIAMAAGSFGLGQLLGLGAEGVMLSQVLSNFAMTISGLILSRKYLKTHLPWQPLLGIFAAGLIAFGVAYLLPLRGVPDFEYLLIDAVIFLAAYLTLVPVLQGMNDDDFIRLSIAAETMGPTKRMIGVFVNYERRILRLRKRGDAV
ncbi:MAG TPA: oligosaccharide flippase family protein [Nitrososphaerales archaeon]|nr:oligosaccharide flippase family protein [Nitrososphaerales archaeon]